MKTISTQDKLNKLNLILALFTSTKPMVSAFAVLMLIFTFISSAYSSLPLKLGQSVVTSYPQNYSAGYKVLRIIDIRNMPALQTGGNYWSTPPQYSDNTWTAQRMGEVFGIALDNSSPPNIFVAASDIFLPPTINNTGLIFRIDGTTGAVTNYISKAPIAGPPGLVVNTSTIPNKGCGLGNICYDNLHQQIFVTNFEDGIIYRIQGGIVKSFYNPFNSDDGTAGYAPLGQRIWGIGIYDNKVYFSRWQSDDGNHTANNYNEIYSVTLNGSGDFINVPPFLEYGFTTFTNPVSDIEFSNNGDMLLGERSMYGTQISAHNSRMIELPRVNGSYGSSIIHRIGSTNTGSTNSCGGVDFGFGLSDSLTNSNSKCDSIVTCTGDLLYSPPGGYVYGFQVIKRSSAGASNVQDYSQYVDLNGDLNGGDKTTPGDIDIYTQDLCSQSICDLTSASAISIPTTCAGDCRWQVNLTHPADMSGISRVQFLTTGSSTFSNFTWNSAYNSWNSYSNTNTNQSRGPATGNLPGGNLTDVVRFCISNSVSNPKKVIVNWLSGNGSIVCGDTLELYCEVPCMSITSNTVTCLSSTNYSVKFDFTNNSNFNMKTLELTSVTPAGAVINPSTITLGTSIPPNGNASNITFGLSNVTPLQQVCIQIKAISSDNCCWCYDTICVTIPECVCENLDYNLIPISTINGYCEYRLNLINNYKTNYFTGVQTEIISSGANFKTMSTNTWGFNPFRFAPVVEWFPTAGKIPLGNTNNEIYFSLSGYAANPQKIVLRWMRGANRDTVVCTDTLVLHCVPLYGVTDTCSQLAVVTTKCISGGFEYKFKIQNNSWFNATGFLIQKLSPAGAVFAPTNFPAVPINQNTLSTQQSINITNVVQGQRVCFKISLYKEYTQNGQVFKECCHSDTICMNMPYCDFTGGDTVGVLISPQSLGSVLDTFSLQLRNATYPFALADSTQIFSQVSGPKQYLNGVFSYADSGSSYYIVVKHRNSLETWSANPVYYNGHKITYDFTTSLSKAYGSNMILENGLASIYSGDVDQNGIVDLTDIVNIFNASSSFTIGYVVTDLNGDNFVDLTDLSIAFNNSSTFVQVMRP